MRKFIHGIRHLKEVYPVWGKLSRVTRKSMILHYLWLDDGWSKPFIS